MKTEVKSESSRFLSLVQGVLVGYAVTVIIFLAYSILITYTNMPDDKTPIVVAAATLVSVMIAGFDAARGAEAKGWFWGIMAGLIYAIILVALMTIVLKEFAYDSRTVTLLLLSLAGGGLGGVIGINFTK
ncbi:MAG: TIGR04086 family membrane protein [Clostridiales bacterium]|nr:TIGR04086 family membrane protein [Clostridiales bacterium]